MTLRDVPTASGVDPDPGVVLAVVASVADAAVLAPLGLDAGAGAAAELVATGPAPMEVDLALDDHGAPAARVLLVDVLPAAGPAAQLAVLLPRLDDLIRESRARGVVVRGGSAAALAAAQSAVWRRVPVVHLAEPGASGTTAANQAQIASLVGWQSGPAGALAHPGDLALRVYRALVPSQTPQLVPLTATGPIPISRGRTA